MTTRRSPLAVYRVVRSPFESSGQRWVVVDPALPATERTIIRGKVTQSRDAVIRAALTHLGITVADMPVVHVYPGKWTEEDLAKHLDKTSP